MDKAWLMPAIPAAAFVIVALLHNWLPRKGDFIAVGASIASFVIFIFIAADLFGQLPAGPGGLTNNIAGFDWIKIDGIDFVLRIGFRVDQLTAVMLCVVSFVGMLVQLYSLGYMKGEVRYGWYFAVLCLFIASMLTLVLADNFLLLYVTWEGVGICSFLLIGHYFERRSAAEAAKKAFITTRFGDVFLLIGIILLWRKVGTFDMSTIFAQAQAGDIDKTYLTMATLFLFGGAMGKSAQFPFHVWLPDAMEGPTPVSALIHAATMVVAGVYLVARTMPLFEASYDGAQYFVVAIGMITTFLSIGMGLVMSDIKRVVAYSTLNSLGLMMVALGFGEKGVGAAMLYLFAHAFFKALLFLGCGSVIHSTEQQEVEHLGGLKDKMPITHATFLIGALAMAGMVPLSGFFAKDEILVAAKDWSWPVLILICITLPITAMYMVRVYMLTFQGEPKDHARPRARARVAADHGAAARPAGGAGDGRRLCRVRAGGQGDRNGLGLPGRDRQRPGRRGREVQSRLGHGGRVVGARARRHRLGRLRLERRRGAGEGRRCALPVRLQAVPQQVLHRRLLPVGDQQRRPRVREGDRAVRPPRRQRHGRQRRRRGDGLHSLHSEVS